MSLARIDVEISSGVFETIKTYTKAAWDIPLNGIRYFDIIVDASGPDYRTDFALNRNVELYFNESLDMKGIILKRTHTSTGALRLEGMGFGEKKMGQANCSLQAFSSTNTTGVVNSDSNNLLSKVPSISAGNIENQTVNNFRTDLNESTLNALTKLTELTGQDWSFDDANDELDVEDHKGSSSTIGDLVDGVNVTNVSNQEDDQSTVKKITVIGKGFGSNQVSGTASAGFSQGDAEVTIVDKSLDSNQECADKAVNLLAIQGVTRFSYNFEVVNPFFSFALGDVVTLTSEKIGVDSTNLRIVKFKRVSVPGRTSLFFQVRGTGEREQAESKYAKDIALLRAQREYAAMTQPSDDGTGSIGLSGNVTSAPSITSITGGVTSAASVTSVTGAVSTTGASENGYQLGNYSTSLTGDNTWRSVGTSINTANALFFFHGLTGKFELNFSDATPGDVSQPQSIFIRAKNTTNTEYYPYTTSWKTHKGNIQFN